VIEAPESGSEVKFLITRRKYFKDEADPNADAVAARLPAARATVPLIWPLEVASAVLMGEQRQKW
jgi:hypothetical protein